MFQGERFRQAFEMFQRGDFVNIFKEDEYAGVLWGYGELAKKEWNRRLGGGRRVWISHDIGIDSDLLIPGKSVQLVDIGVDLSEYLPFPGYHPYALTAVEANTRSRFAQLGLTIWELGNLAKTIYIAGIKNGEPQYRAQLPVSNLAARPIFLPKKTPFFNTYERSHSRLLMDDALQEELGKSILLDPREEGKTWWLCREQIDNETYHTIGIEFLLNPERRCWIPPSDEPLTLNASPTVLHNRAEVDTYLVPVPETSESIYWIGEIMSHLRLMPDIHGLMATYIPSQADGQGPLQFQTNSVLIRGGNTDSKLRTEIWSATTSDVIPKKTLLHFCKA